MKAYWDRRRANPELYGNQQNQQTKKEDNKMKKQDKANQEAPHQPPAQPTPVEALTQPPPTEATPPPPTLATALMATIQKWQKEHPLTEDQILAVLEEVWQGWDR